MCLKTPGHQEYVNHCGWATIELCDRVRQQMGREAQQAPLFIGSQSAKTTEKGAECFSELPKSNSLVYNLSVDTKWETQDKKQDDYRFQLMVAMSEFTRRTMVRCTLDK